MPTSSQYGKPYTIAMLTALHKARPFATVLDMGCGEGFYRHRLAPCLPGARWIGVEVWEPYIREFELASHYDKIIQSDARDVDFAQLKTVDLVIFGDMLEHMPKEDAVLLVQRALAASAMVLISIPVVEYPQEEIHGNPYERHVKDDWNHYEVMSSFAGVSAFMIHDHIGVYILTRDSSLNDMVCQAQPQITRMIRQQQPNDRMAWGEWHIENFLI